MAKIGLFAGIPQKWIHHFERFGESLGFRNHTYPDNAKHILSHDQVIDFESVSIKANETFGHCPHMLDYEIRDEGELFILSCDYDFSPVPWYGIPQRGDSIDLFKEASAEIIKRNPDIIISSHLEEPVKPESFKKHLSAFTRVIDARTDTALHLLGDNEISLHDINDFIYPVKKMGGRYSDDYIQLAAIWDKWLLIAHLEHAWKENRVECTYADNDLFLEQCIHEGNYKERTAREKKGTDWARATRNRTAPWELPFSCRWKQS